MRAHLFLTAFAVAALAAAPLLAQNAPAVAPTTRPTAAPPAAVAPPVAPSATAPAVVTPPARPAAAAPAAPAAAAAGAAATPARPAAVVGAKVNLNTASAEDLDTLPGIGAARSKVIIDERAKAKFKDWADFDKRMTGNSVNAGVKAGIKNLVTF